MSMRSPVPTPLEPSHPRARTPGSMRAMERGLGMPDDVVVAVMSRSPNRTEPGTGKWVGSGTICSSPQTATYGPSREAVSPELRVAVSRSLAATLNTAATSADLPAYGGLISRNAPAHHPGGHGTRRSQQHGNRQKQRTSRPGERRSWPLSTRGRHRRRQATQPSDSGLCAPPSWKSCSSSGISSILMWFLSKSRRSLAGSSAKGRPRSSARARSSARS